MANKNKAKGTRAESRVVKYLKSQGIKAKRKSLSGSNDEGDIELPDWDICLEVKTGKQTANYNRAQLNEWLRQTYKEGMNAFQLPFLVIVRYNRKIEDAEVWFSHPKESKMLMQYLDDWCAEQVKIIR